MDQFKFEFTKLSFENLNRHIRLADIKAKFILTVDLAVISAILAAVFKLAPQEVHVKEILYFSAFLLLVAMAFLFLSFINTVMIISPILSKKNNPSKLLYWEQIDKLSLEELEEKYQNSDNEDMYKQLVDQIYFYSKTATEQYRRVSNAIKFMFAAINLAVAAFLSYGLAFI